MAEQRSPKPQVGGSIPSWPARCKFGRIAMGVCARLIFLSSSKEIGIGASLDWLKWGLVGIIVALAVYANWYYQEQSLFLRVLGLLIAGAAAFLIAVKTEKGNAAWNLIKEARSEIRRVVWPTNNETTQTTLVVIVMVFIFSLILWGLDSLLSWLVSSLIG